MLIKKFQAKRVHKYLDFDISFNDEINFLVGLNGCGKTTALKLISSILTPDIIFLAKTPFDGCYISFFSTRDKEDYIDIQKDDKSLILKSSLLPAPLTFDLNYVMENQLDKDAIEPISRITNPVLISLDRKFADLKSNDEREQNASSFWITYHKSITGENEGANDKDPLHQVKVLIRNEIRGIEKKNLIENERLKDKILLDSFTVINDFKAVKFDGDLDLKDIENKEFLILEALNSLNLRSKNLKDVTAATKKFFKELQKNADIIIKEKNKPDNKNKKIFISSDALGGSNQAYMEALLFLIANQPQIFRINNLVEFIKESQQERIKSYEKIDLFEDIVNSFFSQTHKRISIKTGNLKITVNGEDNLDVNSLSSGETQILTLFAHMIFNKRLINRALLMIDEPELSLHLAWQEMFVESLKRANSDLQIILATHSPAIINGNDSSCVFVRP